MMTLLLAVLFVVAGTWGITRWVYRRMLASETRKAEAQRQRLGALVNLSSQPPRAAGFDHRRVS